MASNYNMTIETATEEFDSLANVSGCTKNPGHEHFYSVADLNYDILPVEWRNEQWLTQIRNWSKRVVKLTVNKANGTKMYGTGYVMKDHDSGIFYIVTNEHVISKQEDVERCKIEFFFETEDRLGIETSYGSKMLAALKKRDICVFTLNTVPQAIKQVMSIMSIDSPALNTSLNVIVISHPHGSQKTITIGKMLGVEIVKGVNGVEGDDRSKMIHNARTCPGSSGGLVLMSGQYIRPPDMLTHFAGETGDIYHGKLEEDAYTCLSETGNINYCTH